MAGTTTTVDISGILDLADGPPSWLIRIDRADVVDLLELLTFITISNANAQARERAQRLRETFERVLQHKPVDG